MFSASKIQRAAELNAMFLQCEKLFHVLSIAELQSRSLYPNYISWINFNIFIRKNPCTYLFFFLSFSIFMMKD